MDKNELVLFQSNDGEVSLNVNIDDDTVWLTNTQICELFARDRTVVSRHIANIYKEGELVREGTCAKNAQVQIEGSRTIERQVDMYNLDVVISVGYRVKSRRGIEFRRWATDVLKRYLIEGYAKNDNRLLQLGRVIDVMARIPSNLEAAQILDVLKTYTEALTLLDDYDHQALAKPKGTQATYILDYDDCRAFIESMHFSDESELFGTEKDDSFKGCIGNIYQSFSGVEIYPSLQEKAANLLYFLIKDHPFLDGNKRIAAALFVYFLEKNDALIVDNHMIIDNSALVAITIMIAESRPEEKETMIALMMNFTSNLRD